LGGGRLGEIRLFTVSLKHTDFKSIEQLKNDKNEMAEQIVKMYSHHKITYRRTACIFNAFYTAGKRFGLMSQAIFNEMLVNDPNLKANSINGKDYKRFVAEFLKNDQLVKAHSKSTKFNEVNADGTRSATLIQLVWPAFEKYTTFEYKLDKEAKIAFEEARVKTTPETTHDNENDAEPEREADIETNKTSGLDNNSSKQMTGHDRSKELMTLKKKDLLYGIELILKSLPESNPDFKKLCAQLDNFTYNEAMSLYETHGKIEVEKLASHDFNIFILENFLERNKTLSPFQISKLIFRAGYYPENQFKLKIVFLDSIFSTGINSIKIILFSILKQAYLGNSFLSFLDFFDEKKFKVQFYSDQNDFKMAKEIYEKYNEPILNKKIDYSEIVSDKELSLWVLDLYKKGEFEFLEVLFMKCFEKEAGAKILDDILVRMNIQKNQNLKID
jgi:hypothetical protein